MTVSMAFVNKFFDFDNFTEPVQEFIDDTIFFEIDPTIRKNANL